MATKLLSHSILTYTTILILLLLPLTSSSPSYCTCNNNESNNKTEHNKKEALKYKLISISSILTSGALGVSIPLLSNKIPNLKPESDIFFMIKAFAAGVILATGFIHILPDAFKNLKSPCLNQNTWGKFPFTGFVAMVSSIGTLMVDCFATGYYKRAHFRNTVKKVRSNGGDEEKIVVAVNGGDSDSGHDGHVHVHTHATHGHAHGSSGHDHDGGDGDKLVRHRVISQVLELGIVVHSVIIGISLGASQSPDTIKPLLAALSFHQFFEGMGLGGCISQAKFESRSMLLMALFFSLTTPAGIGIGIGVSSVYSENSATALIVEGIFNAASAGILIYMALVDILAADFMNPKMQSNIRLQLGSYTSLLLGCGCMSVMAIWA